jgi:hypothetical protein
MKLWSLSKQSKQKHNSMTEIDFLKKENERLNEKILLLEELLHIYRKS